MEILCSILSTFDLWCPWCLSLSMSFFLFQTQQCVNTSMMSCSPSRVISLTLPLNSLFCPTCPKMNQISQKWNSALSFPTRPSSNTVADSQVVHDTTSQVWAESSSNTVNTRQSLTAERLLQNKWTEIFFHITNCVIVWREPLLFWNIRQRLNILKIKETFLNSWMNKNVSQTVQWELRKSEQRSRW